MQTIILAIVAAVALLVSTFANPRKSLTALRVAGKRLLSLLPSFLTMVALVSLVLAFVSRDTVVAYLGRERLFEASAIAAALGSLLLMPGFVAYPLAGLLVQQGVARTVVAAFTTTLMMVGVLTFPIERRYFGTKVALIRNALSLVVTIAVTIAVGICYGEIGR